MKTNLYLLTFFGTFFAVTTAMADPKPEKTITVFSADENKEMSWQITNDGVMGGLSKGNVSFTDSGQMKFSGDLSLQNNGGFSLVKTKEMKLNLEGHTGLILRVKGDGRTYQVRLTSDAKFRSYSVSFSGEFKTKADEWVEVKIPFSQFKGSFRGFDLPDSKLNPADIRELGIIIADKKQAPFSLKVDWIKTYAQ